MEKNPRTVHDLPPPPLPIAKPPPAGKFIMPRRAIDTKPTPPAKPPPVTINASVEKKWSTHSGERSISDVKAWDVFRLLPLRVRASSPGLLHTALLQCLRLLTFPLVFLLTLLSAVACKATFLLMTSAIGHASRNVTLCSYSEDFHSVVVIETEHVVKYVWAVLLALCAPEFFCFVRAAHRIAFRTVAAPSFLQFFIVLSIETLVAFGVGTLVFELLPQLDVLSGAMLMSAMCFTPAVLSLLARKPSRVAFVLVLLDVVCIGAQATGLWAWTAFVPDMAKHNWSFPVAVVCISLAFWENYLNRRSVFPCIRRLAAFADSLQKVRSRTYIIIAPWKCLIYIATLFMFTSVHIGVSDLIVLNPFSAQSITVINSGLNSGRAPPSHNGFGPEFDRLNPTFRERLDGISELINSGKVKRQIAATTVQTLKTAPYDAIWIFLLCTVLGFLTYQCAKFACKVTMQRFSYALPLTLSSPLLVVVLKMACTRRAIEACFLSQFLPWEVFWTCSEHDPTWSEFLSSPKTWFWMAWVISQVVIVFHVWTPKIERLADTDRIFVLPYYTVPLLDQWLMLNRRRDETGRVKTEYIDLDHTGSCDTDSEVLSAKSLPSATASDAITRIYACATMWHETRGEMLCMLTSIFRMDEDQCARRNAQKYLRVVDPDYYEFEAHIVFDDAFELNEFGEPVLNRFVHQLLEVVDYAAGAVHQISMRVKSPKKYSTVYGGQLIYTLPGHNKLTVHLKDSNKIRQRKRWSQVMYMYFLLGHRLMESVGDLARKEIIAGHSYILTLDGDVDFQPDAVRLLVDLMKKNARVGAACGRIHPRGSGPMIWYQKFEYAIGHWFQKATEHMIGCVLCSPGCFSLFRVSALMDDDVLRRYAIKAERAKDFIQYDQGEDRWLCTLLLERGYRVEYCAAADALTFAPQSFHEFFNQRRRWIPSTIANIIDILHNYRSVVKLNDSISTLYIIYQFAMLASSILGPGTIFLMVAGAVNISFSHSVSASFAFVLMPVILYVLVCFLCKPNTQIIVAQVIAAWFALLMMAVIVGTALQIKKDGVESPHSIFLLILIGSCFVAAVLHPLEFTCCLPGVVYFLAIPCTYMLLSIYAVCNLHIVQWGTRETVPNDERKRKGMHVGMMEDGGYSPDEIEGAYSIGCGPMCRLMCCIQPSAIGRSPQIESINTKLDKLDRHLDMLDKRLTRPDTSEKPSRMSEATRPLLADDNDNENDEEGFEMAYHKQQKEKAARSESWLSDRYLRHAEKDKLEPEESRFWTELIDRYLFPLKKDASRPQIEADLVSLRNQICFGFFMSNALFILIVFLLQTKKDCLNVEWPLGAKRNRTFVPCNSNTGEEIEAEAGLQLEPIGFVFLFFFMALLVVQFIAMLLHRFGTLSHIIAFTEFAWPCFSRKRRPLSDDELVAENYVEIAKELQAIRGLDPTGAEAEAGPTTISRRQIVRNLENSRRSQMNNEAKRTDTLDAAFRKRFFNLNGGEYDGFERGGQKRKSVMRNDTLRAIKNRRDKIYGTLDECKGKNPFNSESTQAASARLPIQDVFAQSGSDEPNTSMDEAGSGGPILRSNVLRNTGPSRHGGIRRPLEDGTTEMQRSGNESQL